MASRCYLPFLSSRQALKFLRNKTSITNSSRNFTEAVREPSQPLGSKQPKWMSADEAVKVVKSGNNFFYIFLSMIFFFICFIEISDKLVAI